MRALFVVITGLLLTTAVADARGKRRSRTSKRVAVTKPAAKEKLDKPAKKPRSRAQSFGAPWSGSLANGTRLAELEHTHIRRPQRTYGTRTTVEHTRRAILDTLDAFPRAHVYAIGDLSQDGGGWISEHHSHQSGRDVDLGLFYKKRPAGYPDSFVTATDKTLDPAPMWFLIRQLAQTQSKDGGVLVMFLDFDVQGIIYDWAKNHGVDEDRLDKIFQFPHGRGASAGIVRHEPNHANHLHVRFQCAAADTSCR